MGFESGADARQMLEALKERLATFGLALVEDKTRLIEFGRPPALARRQRGERRPATSNFLGSIHYGGWTRDGRFIIKHKAQSKRLSRKALCCTRRPERTQTSVRIWQPPSVGRLANTPRA